MFGHKTTDNQISAPTSSQYGTFHIFAHSSSVARQSFSERTIAWSNGVNWLALVHVEMAKDIIYILPMIDRCGTLGLTINKLETHDPVRVFFLHRKSSMKLFSHKFEAHYIVYMDSQNDDIIICGEENVHSVIRVHLVVTYVGKFMVQEFVPATGCPSEAIEASYEMTYPYGSIIKSWWLSHIYRLPW